MLPLPYTKPLGLHSQACFGDTGSRDSAAGVQAIAHKGTYILTHTQRQDIVAWNQAEITQGLKVRLCGCSPQGQQHVQSQAGVTGLSHSYVQRCHPQDPVLRVKVRHLVTGKAWTPSGLRLSWVAMPHSGTHTHVRYEQASQLQSRKTKASFPLPYKAREHTRACTHTHTPLQPLLVLCSHLPAPTRPRAGDGQDPASTSELLPNPEAAPSAGPIISRPTAEPGTVSTLLPHVPSLKKAR